MLARLCLVVVSLVGVAFQLSWSEPIDAPLRNLYSTALAVLAFAHALERAGCGRNLEVNERTQSRGSKPGRCGALLETATLTASLLSLLIFLPEVQALCVLQVLPLSRCWDEFKAQLNLAGRRRTSLRLGELLLTVLLAAHFWSCWFIYIGRASAHEQNWIADSALDAEDRTTLYANAFYYSIISMTTIGYGDIRPINVFEKLYVTLMAIVSSGNFAYTVNSIGQILSELAKKKERFEHDRHILLHYLEERSISRPLQQ